MTDDFKDFAPADWARVLRHPILSGGNGDARFCLEFRRDNPDCTARDVRAAIAERRRARGEVVKPWQQG